MKIRRSRPFVREDIRTDRIRVKPRLDLSCRPFRFRLSSWKGCKLGREE